MHWVDRGPEPADLNSVRKRRTPKWIAYYRDNTGPKPTDLRLVQVRRRVGQPVLTTLRLL